VQFNNLTPEVFENKLSLILKVRAMENFCAVLLESDNENNCYQTGLNKTAQILKPIDGIWIRPHAHVSRKQSGKTKDGLQGVMATNFTWLVESVRGCPSAARVKRRYILRLTKKNVERVLNMASQPIYQFLCRALMTIPQRFGGAFR
jgi:hypothetical protein